MKSKPSRTAISTSILVCLLVLVSIVPIGAVAQNGGESEPNDARAAATPLQGSINGEIVVEGGVDWYSAEFTKGETVSFLVTKAINEPGLTISLYGPNGKKLDKDYSEEYDRRMQVATSTANYTGTYYVKVQSYNTSKTEIPYVVRSISQSASTEASTHNEGEPNDAWETATSLQKESVRGALSGSGDVDWYSAEFTKGETVSFLITDKQVNISNVDIYLYHPNGTKIKSKRISEDDTRSQIAYVAKQTGTYYLRVEPGYLHSPMNSSLAYSIRLPDQPEPPETSLSTSTNTVAPTQTETLSSSQTTATNRDTATNSASTGTSSQTETDSSDSNTGESANTPVEEETTSMFGPGFTSVGAIVALLSAALFTIRRQ